jgi:hypothetical protein
MPGRFDVGGLFACPAAVPVTQLRGAKSIPSSQPEIAEHE